MLSVIVGAILAVAVPQEAVADAAKELATLAEKLSEAESYRFTAVSAVAESKSAGRGGGTEKKVEKKGGDAPFELPPAMGSYKRNLPMKLHSGDVVAYKDGDQIVFPGKGGKWVAAVVGEKSAASEAITKEVWFLMGVTAPHERFRDFAGKVTEVEKHSRDGAVVYTGKLREKAAQSLGGGYGGKGGGYQVDVSATFTIEVEGDAIRAVQWTVTHSGTFDEWEFEKTSTETVTFDEIGDTEYEVPAEVLSKFEI